jgi:hypothetical protein
LRSLRLSWSVWMFDTNVLCRGISGSPYGCEGRTDVLRVGERRNEGLIWLDNLLRQCRGVSCATGFHFVGCFVRLCNRGQFHGGLRDYSHRIITMTRAGDWELSPLSAAKLWPCGRLDGGGSGGLCSLQKCCGEKLNTPSTLHHSARWQTCIIAPSVLKFAGHLKHGYVLCSLSSCCFEVVKITPYPCKVTHKHFGALQLLQIS